MEAVSISEEKGKGLKGSVDGYEMAVTSRKQIEKMGVVDKEHPLPTGMGLECFVLINGKLGAYFRFRDTHRDDSRPFVTHLQPKHGIHTAMIVSGDRKEEVQYLADAVGITEVYAEKARRKRVKSLWKKQRRQKPLTSVMGSMMRRHSLLQR